MLDTLGLFAWSFGVAIGPVISPGAVSAAVVTEGARRGFRVGPLISTGHALMELLMVSALALGMGQVLRYPLLASSVGILGGLFLACIGGKMGWDALRHKPTLPQPPGCEHPEPVEGRDIVEKPISPRKDRSGFYGLIGLGIATTVSNPFWFLWWIGVGGGYVLATWQAGLIALCAFYLGHITADYVWNTFLASVVGSGRRWLSDRVYNSLLLMCGLFLVYTGLRFVWAGVSRLLV
ncbi:MAG: LysE family transporter [Anaerolineae bacterium]